MSSRAQHMIQVVVEPADLDELGHVNNIVYLRWVEAVARAHSDFLGFDLDRYRELGAVPVVHRHEIAYHTPAHAGDKIEIRTRIASLRGVRATRETRIERDGALLADAKTEWVWVEQSTMRPTRIPEAVLEAFAAEP